MVMSYEDFEGRTGKMGVALRARGTNLAKIDKALKDYHKKVKGVGTDGKIALVSEIIVECEKWLKEKSVNTGTGSELFQRRRWAVKDLGKQALAELLILNPAALADVAYSRRKIETLGSYDRPESKALEGGYAHERTAYLDSNKTAAPMSGSKVHGAHKNLKEFAPKETALKNKKFEDLSYADFVKIHKLAAKEQLAGEVDFLTKAQRKAFLAIPQGGFFVDGTGNNIDAPDPPDADGRWPYAMDDYGNFFTKAEGSTKANVEMFNHSSFNAGKSVTCAGMVKILNGRLIWIDNSSGHYKPTKKNLHAMLCVLGQEGIDLARAGVGLYDFTTGRQQVFLYKASNFLVDINYGFPRLLADDQEIYKVLAALSANRAW
jgi:hypothetical protein